MTLLIHENHHKDLIRRLKRVEWQIRGLQKMIDSGEDCEKIAQQMAAGRKAFDRVFYNMVACMLETHAGGDQRKAPEITELIARLS
jgi:DNA-binding FrmR family transcriptional regulator